MGRWRGLVLALGLTALVCGGPRPALAQSKGEWWQPSMLVDYGVIAAGGATLGILSQIAPAPGSGIGPSFDAKNPSAILDSRYSSSIGRPFLYENTGETVPARVVGVAIVPVAAWLVAQEAFGHERLGDVRGLRVHEVGVGLAETLALSLTVTNVLKFSFGRLRPDFQDRVRRFYCNQPDHQGVACTGNEQPLDPDPSKWQGLLDDGRRSFPSGHSSTSFALATYAVLATGGRWVWSPDATASSRAWGIGGQLSALALASYVAWTRVRDGRHNLSDVLSGAAIGTAMANLAYWRRFDSDGTTRRRPMDVGASFDTTSASLSFSVGW